MFFLCLTREGPGRVFRSRDKPFYEMEKDDEKKGVFRGSKREKFTLLCGPLPLALACGEGIPKISPVEDWPSTGG